MKIYLIPMDKMVKGNNLKEVSNPVYFDRGNVPTSDGLFSLDIFGNDMTSRKQTFAYIDLHSHFLQPVIYKSLKRMDRRIVNIAAGMGKYAIDSNGQIVEDEEKGKSGLDWLYSVWDKINWKRNDSHMRNERIDLLEINPKDTIFTTKFLVIPPFTRDINLQGGSGKVKIHEVNNYYSKLIRNAKMIKSESEFDFVLNNNRFQIQQTLEELYDFFGSKLEGKHGLIRRQLMSKSVTNSVISVITNPRFNRETVKRIDDEYINMEYVGIPLSQALIEFFPFVMYHLKRRLINNFELNNNKIPYYPDNDMSKDPIYYKLDNPMMYFNDDVLKKRIDLFINTPETRFDIVEVPCLDKDGKRVMKPLYFSGRLAYDGSSIFNRHMTWMDLLYISTVEATEGKHCKVTRHPVLDSFGSFIAKPRLLTTIKVKDVIINDKVFKYYPVVDFNLKPNVLSAYFIDTTSFSNSLAPGLGADYDGDTTTIKGIWEQNANIAAEKVMYNKNNIIAINGQNRRTLSNESIQVLYNLTK